MLSLNTNALLKANIIALLKARGQTRRSLAQWCRCSDAWISKILADPERELPLKYFDRVADFFGIAPYQLLQPGISPLLERRTRSDRRTGRDRRISQAVLSEKPGDVDLMAVIRALTREEREDLIADGLDRLNKRLRHRPSAESGRAVGDHTAESSRPARAPVEKDKRRA